MFTGIYLAALLSQLAAPTSQLRLSRGADALEVSWADAEDRIDGTVTPLTPRVGDAIDVVVQVGSFEGAQPLGPVTFTLRRQDARGGGQSQTVARANDEPTWKARFAPEERGEYRLEIAFGTTRRKVAAGTLYVEEAKLPRWPWWVAVGGTVAVVVGLGVRNLLQKKVAA